MCGIFVAHRRSQARDGLEDKADRPLLVRLAEDLEQLCGSASRDMLGTRWEDAAMGVFSLPTLSDWRRLMHVWSKATKPFLHPEKVSTV